MSIDEAHHGEDSEVFMYGINFGRKGPVKFKYNVGDIVVLHPTHSFFFHRVAPKGSFEGWKVKEASVSGCNMNFYRLHNLDTNTEVVVLEQQIVKVL